MAWALANAACENGLSALIPRTTALRFSSSPATWARPPSSGVQMPPQSKQ